MRLVGQLPWFVSIGLAVLLGPWRSDARAAEYFVAQNGSDSNAGTLAAPFKTVGKARDVVRTVNSNMTEDIVVNLRDGWYFLSSALTFDQRDSG